jgi:hypothetical protein
VFPLHGEKDIEPAESFRIRHRRARKAEALIQDYLLIIEGYKAQGRELLRGLPEKVVARSVHVKACNSRP